MQHRALTLAVMVACAPAAAAVTAQGPELRAQLSTQLDQFKDVHPNARILPRADLLAPHLFLRLQDEVAGATPAEKALAWADANRAVLGLGADQLQVENQSQTRRSAIVTLQQVHRVGQGERSVVLPVHGRTLKVTVTNGKVTRVVNETYPVIGLSLSRAPLSKADAQAAAAALHEGSRISPDAHEVIIAGPQGAYEALRTFVAPNPTKLEVLEVLVDRRDGEIRGVRSTVNRYDHAHSNPAPAAR